MKTILTLMTTILIIVPCFAQQDLHPVYLKELNFKGNKAYYNGALFTGVLIDEKLDKVLGVFQNGYKNGVFVSYYENGMKKNEINYIMGVKDGLEAEWYDNGNKSRQVTMNNGLQNGLHQEWYHNGSLKTEIFYSNGSIVDGEYIIFDEKGEIIEKNSYKNNHLVEKKYRNGKLEQFYENGALKFECYLNESGNQDGQYIEWWSNGYKKEEGSKNNGKLNGPLTTWDANTIKTSTQYYKDGIKDSIFVYWNIDGLITTQYYNNGLLIKEDIINNANLISNYANKQNMGLYYYIDNDGKDTVFVNLIFEHDHWIKLSANNKNDMIMFYNILSSVQKRLVFIKPEDRNLYKDKYISFKVVLSHFKYYVKSDKEGMYHGHCSYIIRLYDDKNIEIFEDKFDSKDKEKFIKVSHGSKDRALAQGARKIDCEDYMYKFFPVNSKIIEITSMNNNKARGVKISAGSEVGTKRKLQFNVYKSSDNLSKSAIIGVIEVLKVFPTYSLCIVNSGEEDILNNFNSNHELSIISK